MDPSNLNDPIWLQIPKLVFDLLKSVAWPVAAIIIAALFRSDLQALLPRLRRAGPTGFEFEAIEKRKQAAEFAPTNPGELKALPGLERTDAMARIEKKLHEDIQVINNEDRLDVALRALSLSQLQTHFALTYNTIFGSQILALKLLNERGGSVSVDDAHTFFDDIKEKNEIFSSWTFEQYINFLKTSLLIEQHGDHITLSDIGRDFLFFLVRYRLSENKPF